jgi:hypothetical protein
MQHTAKYLMLNAEVINYYAVGAMTTQPARQPTNHNSLPG